MVTVFFTALRSTEVAVIVTEPFLTPVTTPLLTVATLVSLEVHVTFLFTAFDGDATAVKVVVCPTAIVVLPVIVMSSTAG